MNTQAKKRFEVHQWEADPLHSRMRPPAYGPPGAGSASTFPSSSLFLSLRFIQESFHV
jgi:hypothetical protein